MKINSSLGSVAGGSAVDDAGRTSRKTATTTSSSTTGDSVQLSPLSSSLQSIEQGFSSTPVVDPAHVAAIKQAIASGQFKVDAGKVADRLLQTAQDLIMAHKA